MVHLATTYSRASGNHALRIGLQPNGFSASVLEKQVSRLTIPILKEDTEALIGGSFASESGRQTVEMKGDASGKRQLWKWLERRLGEREEEWGSIAAAKDENESADDEI